MRKKSERDVWVLRVRTTLSRADRGLLREKRTGPTASPLRCSTNEYCVTSSRGNLKCQSLYMSKQPRITSLRDIKPWQINKKVPEMVTPC